MSQIIKATFEAFANYLCKGTVNVNVGNLYTVYFRQLTDGRISIECYLWRENAHVLAAFEYEKNINIVQAYKLYCDLYEISQHEK